MTRPIVLRTDTVYLVPVKVSWPYVQRILQEHKIPAHGFMFARADCAIKLRGLDKKTNMKVLFAEDAVEIEDLAQIQGFAISREFA